MQMYRIHKHVCIGEHVYLVYRIGGGYFGLDPELTF
jgi:hypothetical protein